MRKMNNGRYAPFLFNNVTFDLCALMAGKWDILFFIFSKHLRGYTNFYEPCPRRGYLYMKENPMDFSDFPPILPDGAYYLVTTVYTNRKKKEQLFLSQSTGHGEVIPVGIERF